MLIIYHQMLDVENKNVPLTLALSPAGRGDEEERVPERQRELSSCMEFQSSSSLSPAGRGDEEERVPERQRGLSSKIFRSAFSLPQGMTAIFRLQV
ncbi:MAG: hypothetical protein Q8O01_01990, partial [Candidatus Omnitrophota bacterium]|nr:hypothetical protein [Candidatus Omnitrophota bacterium]